MAVPGAASSESASVSGFAPGVPPMPENATGEQKDLHWYKHVYQGDKMPQLTLRAVMMGGILGMLMAASNLYTTLAIGWAFGVAITACVMSFVIWNICTGLAGHIVTRFFVGIFGAAALVLLWVKLFPGLRERLGETLDINTARNAAAGAIGLASACVLGVVALLWRRLTPMSVLENNCMQSTASAAGYSTGSTLATMFGALLLLQDPGEGQTWADIKSWNISPIWAVVVFTLCTGLMGVFLAIPLKRQMINHEGLRFPSGVAAAETLRSLYSQSKDAMSKAYTLIAGIVVGATVGVLNTGEGTLGFLDKMFEKIQHFAFNIRLPEMVPADGFAKYYGVAPQAFGFESSVLLIAAGVITRMRVCLSMFVGSAILYWWVGPWLLSQDLAVAGSGWVEQGGKFVYDKATRNPDVVRNIDLNVAGTTLRFTTWALWGGTAIMVFASLTAVAMQWKSILRAFTGLKSEAGHAPGDSELARKAEAVEVPALWMIIGMIPIAAAMLYVQIVAFHISWWAGCIAIALSFFLSLVACRATGETDTTPIGAMGKVMQLLFAVLHPGQIVPNLASAGIAANSASSSADLLTDLKSGYLLGANPRRQFLAQFMGVFFGTVAVVPVWFLMVPTREALEKYPAPGTRQWEAVARVLTKGIEFLPDSAKWAILIGATLGVALPILDRIVPSKVRPYLPSAMGLGLSWVIPFSSAFGFFVGAVIGWIWEKLHRRSSDRFSIAAASGLIAGESLVKALIAMTATALGIFASKGGTP